MLKKMDQMNMKEKLQFGYMLVIGLMIVITIFSAAGLFFVQGKMNSYINGAQAADTAVRTCRIESNIAARKIRELALNDDKDKLAGYKEEIEESMTIIEEALEDLKAAGVIESGIPDGLGKLDETWIPDCRGAGGWKQGRGNFTDYHGMFSCAGGGSGDCKKN